MADNSCCSCILAIYEVDELNVMNYITCSKGFTITEKMIIDEHCNEYAPGISEQS